jgi:arylsulfatase/arylsulfatase A
VRWPGVLAANREIETPAAHIDLLPTLLEACRVAPPAGVKLDGRSILPLLKREARTLPERPFFVQWHRGNVPQEGRACAVVTTRWKLVQAQGVPEDPTPFTPRWQLFNLAADASEQYDVAAENSQIVDDLRRQYDAWFRDVSGTRGFDPPRIVLGAAQANPVELTRQDWRVEPAAATQTNAMGHWEIEVASASTFRIKVIAMPQTPRGVVHLKVGGIELSQKMQAESDVVPLVECRLPAGPAQVEAWIEVETKEVKGPRRIGPRFVEFSKTQ